MKPIYEPKGAAKEYGDYAINIYTGCPHRCYYCFAPNVLRKDREQFHTCIEPRKDIVVSEVSRRQKVTLELEVRVLEQQEKLKGLAQVKRERDLAVEQLKGYGVALGEEKELAEVVHGHWIAVDSSFWKWQHDTAKPVFRKTFRRSRCRRRTAIRENYCPECGAKMDEQEEAEK